MNLKLAFKAFFKALKEPQFAKKLLEYQEPAQEKTDPSHLRFLNILQKSSRFIDFIKEDLSSYSDSQVGAAVRKIHQDCGQCFEEFVTIRPLFQEEEGSTVTVAKGFDASEIKIVGKVKGEPPFTGVLRHKGWKAHKISLPKQTSVGNREIISPAEIEVH